MLKKIFVMSFLFILITTACGENKESFNVLNSYSNNSIVEKDIHKVDDIIIYTEPVTTPIAIKEKLQRHDVNNISYDRFITEEDPFILISKIVNLGKDLWQIIERNKPVVNVSIDFASAVPATVSNIIELQNFSDLQFQSFRIWGTNLLGQTVFDVVYTLVHQYGGSYKGIGKFLANVTVLPSKIDVKFGYTVSVKVVNVSSINIGTKENPIGSVIMHLKFSVSSVIKYYESNKIFQFRGDSPAVVKISS